MRAEAAQREISAAFFASRRDNREFLGMEIDGLAKVFDLAAKDTRQ